MNRPLRGGLVVASLIVATNSPGQAQQRQAPPQADVGKIEYQDSCASCHGADGKGAGPVAAALKRAPADLTMLAKKNGGVFPVGRMYDTIDGRAEVSSHGPREMPIWGRRFAAPRAPGVSPVAPYFVDPLYDPEAIIRARILSVIDYLYRIQEK